MTDRSPGAGGVQQNSPTQLRDTGKTADSLGEHLQKSLTNLEAGHRSVSAAADGFAFTASLTAVFNSWDKRLGSLRGECWSIGAAFHSTAATDQSVEDGLVAGINQNFVDLLNRKEG